MSDSRRHDVDDVDVRLSWKLIPVALLTGAILYVLVGHLADVEEFLETLAAARWEWFAGCVMLAAGIVTCNGWRFQVVLRGMGYRIGLRRCVAVILTVWPIVLLVPARANDLLRAAVLRDDVPPFSCLGGVVAERFVDVQTLCVLGMIGCGLLGAWVWFAILAAIWAVGWMVVLLTVTSADWLVGLPFVERFEDKIRALFHGFDAFRDRPQYLAATVGVSTLAWVGSMANLWLLCWIFGADVPVAAIMGLWPLALFAGMVPVTIGGMGTRDAVFFGLVAAAVGVGISESALLAATFGYGLVVVLLPGVVGIPLMVRWLAK